MIRILLILSFVLLYNSEAYSQDIHYSQYFNSPLNLNPALTGVFNGDVRLHANYRNQWSSVPVGYTSADFGGDIVTAINEKGNHLGAGVLLNYDRAGDLDLGWNGIEGFVSYSFKLNSSSKITPGLSLGYKSRGFDPSKATTSSQWNGKNIDPTIEAENIGNDNIGFLDLGLGVNFNLQKSYRNWLNLGIGAKHINVPNHRFFSTGTYDATRPIRLNLYGMFSREIGDKIDVLLNGLYSNQNPYQEIVLNGQIKFYLHPASNTNLFVGAGMRLNDAWYPMIAVEVGQLYGAFSYDFNFTDWDIATGGRGGPELSLRYIWSKVPDLMYKPCLIY